MDIEPGVIADIDFANLNYTIEEGEEARIFEQEEAIVMNNPPVAGDE
ncbi:MAG: hypothetical protein ACKPKO_00350 [Candidatus Fonsibacter sp.]